MKKHTLYVREWRLKNKEKNLAYQRKNYTDWYNRLKADPQKAKEYNRKKYLGRREKILIRASVHTAIGKGILKKLPCEKCGEIKVHAHHPDYSKPLDVIWLCTNHHVELHNEINRRLWKK